MATTVNERRSPSFAVRRPYLVATARGELNGVVLTSVFGVGGLFGAF